MHIVTNRLEIPTERVDAFEARFTSNMDNNLVDVVGLRRAALQRPVEPGQPYLAVMEFDTEADYQAWRDSEAFGRSHGKPQPDAPHSAGGPDVPAPKRTTVATAVERYELVHEVFPGAAR